MTSIPAWHASRAKRLQAWAIATAGYPLVVLLPPAVLVALATFYGQLHYAVDVLAGAVVAAAVVAAGRRLEHRTSA